MSRANVRVRPATADALEGLTELVCSLDPSTGVPNEQPVHDANADASTERLSARLTDLVAAPDRALLIATDDSGTVVGLLASRHDEIGAIDLTPVLHVTHLMVLPQHRRRGVGRALLAGAVHLADEAGIENVLSTAAAGSREANRYLARIGFAPLVVHRIAPTAVLRRSLGMTDVAGRMAALRRARVLRSQRSTFRGRALGHGA